VPRLPRPQIPDGLYHITSRGIRQLPIFRDVHDRESYLEILAVVVAKFRWSCLEYCEMTNHFHLLVQTPEANIAAGMTLLNGLYARTFNKRHDLSGHLFDRRYSAEFIQTQEQLVATVLYIAFNPVVAGLCEDPADWFWSSIPATLGLRPAPEFLHADALLTLLAMHSPTQLAELIYSDSRLRRSIAV
jgi:REP element-mobilizing transposase RayT